MTHLASVPTPFGIPLLSLLIFVPILAGLGITRLRRVDHARRAAFATTIVVLALAFAAVALFQGGHGLELVETGARLPWIAARYRLGVDGLSLPLLPMTAMVSFAVIVAGPKLELSRGYLAAILVLEGATMGILASADLALLLFFWTAALVPGFFLIASAGQTPASRERAAWVYASYLFAGSLPLVVATMLLGHVARAVGHADVPFDLSTLLSIGVPEAQQGMIFALIVTSALVRGHLFPFHSWLPMTLEEGPLGLGIMMSGVQVGVYLLARVAFPLLPEACVRYGDPVIGLALASVLYGALLALVQKDLRRTVAFIAVSQSGLMLLGFCAGNVSGLVGALVQSIGAGAGIVGMLVIAWSLEGRAGTTELRDFGGLARVTPKMAAFFFLFALASVGFPGSMSFVGEELLMHGTFEIHPVLAGVALLGPALNGFTLVRAWARTFLGPQPTAERSVVPRLLEDLLPREQWVSLAIVTVCLVGGIAAQPLLTVQGEAIERLHPEAASAHHEPHGAHQEAAEIGHGR